MLIVKIEMCFEIKQKEIKLRDKENLEKGVDRKGLVRIHIIGLIWLSIL